MEPSFWSWEKAPFHLAALTQHPYRNGAQLLELGKASSFSDDACTITTPQWSPAFGAGKSYRQALATILKAYRNGAQLLELGKELAIFSPTDYQCCTSLRAAEVLGQTSRVVAP